MWVQRKESIQHKDSETVWANNYSPIKQQEETPAWPGSLNQTN